MKVPYREGMVIRGVMADNLGLVLRINKDKSGWLLTCLNPGSSTAWVTSEIYKIPDKTRDYFNTEYFEDISKSTNFNSLYDKLSS